jgi:hypothetical protein
MHLHFEVSVEAAKEVVKRLQAWFVDILILSFLLRS